jgi:hypothetical protein
MVFVSFVFVIFENLRALREKKKADAALGPVGSMVALL